MPVITPPTEPRNLGILNARTWAQRRIAQIAGPVPTGKTLYRINGVWHLQASPSQEVLDTADPVYLGGHLYDISEAIYDEIVAAGFAPTLVHAGLYPSSSLYPSTTLYPGG